MPKNTGGGKHKHRKKIPIKVPKKFELLSPHIEDVMYVYISKAYGNRMFDGIIVKNKQNIKFRAQMERRRKRIAVGNLIIMSRSDTFSNEFYGVESICTDDERREIQNSSEYQANLRSILNNNEACSKESNILFEYDQDDENIEIPEQRVIDFPSDSDSDDSELNIDDL